MKTTWTLGLLLAFATVAFAGCQPSAPDKETADLAAKQKKKLQAQKEGKVVDEDEADEKKADDPKPKADKPKQKDEDEPKEEPAPKVKDEKDAPKPKDPEAKAEMPELKGTWKMSGTRYDQDDDEVDVSGEVDFDSMTFTMKWSKFEVRGDIKVKLKEKEIIFKPTAGKSLSAFAGNSQLTFGWNGKSISGTLKGLTSQSNLGKVILTPPEAKAPEPKKK